MARLLSKKPAQEINLLPERDPLELIPPRAVQSLDDPLGLRTLHLGPGVVNLLHGSIQLICMAIRTPTIFRAAIRQNAVQRYFLRRKEREHQVVK